MTRKKTRSYVERAGKDGWRANVLVGKRRVKGSVQATQKQAHADALELLRRRDEPDAEFPDPSLPDAIEAVLKDAEKRDRRQGTIDFYRSHSATLVAHFGDARLSTISTADVQKFIDGSPAAPLTIRHVLQVLTRLYRYHQRTSPASSPRLIKPALIEPDPSLILSWAEAVDVTTADPLLRFVLGFGVRRTETARMRRKDIDIRGRRVIVPVGKRRPRELPLPDGALDVCRAVAKLSTDDWLLPGDTERRRIDYLRGCVHRARAETGEMRIQLHELRKCFGSRVAEVANGLTAAALLGHALPGVTGLYIRADANSLKRAMEDVWADLGRAG